MNIGTILPQVDYTADQPGGKVNCGDEFEKILQQVNRETDMADIAEMKKSLSEKFNVNVVVTEYSCKKTDSAAEIYDTSMLDTYDMNGGRNVVISEKILLRMKEDSSFRQKVYKSIEDIPWASRTTGGCVKGNGVFIHEDGTGGYYLEFDWGDEEEGTKSRKAKVEYLDCPEEKSQNPQAYGGPDNTAYPADILHYFIGSHLNFKREKSE